MKQTHLLLSAILLFSFLLHAPLGAQNSTIDYELSDYKLPYLKRHSLEFYFNSSVSSTFLKRETDNNDPEKTSQKVFNSAISPRYNYYLNSEKFQITQSVSAGIPNISFNSFKDDNNNNKNFEMSPYLNYSGTFREYLKGKFFLEQDINFAYRNSFDRINQEDIDDAGEVTYIYKLKGTTSEINASIPILAGWGRIERVEDARLAVYILDDLNKAEKLTREVTQQDIHELSIRISEVQNERMFDSREKKIWELEQINSFLMEKGLIDSEDIVYFTLLNDNWDYSAGPVRESGFRVSGGISPEIDYNKTVETEDEEYPLTGTATSTESSTSFRDIGGGLLARLSFEKPLNLYWQFSLHNEFGVSKLYRKNVYNYPPAPEDTRKEDVYSIGNYFTLGFGYFPNSRTSMTLFVSESVEYNKFTPEENEERKRTVSSSTLGFNLNYYISPRIRLRINSNLYYYYSNEMTYLEYKYKSLNCSASASLTYMLL
jgi:hypothetical protein